MKRAAPAILLAAIAASASAQPIRYQIGAIIEMPQFSTAYGMSNAAHITGFEYISGGRAFLWRDGNTNILPPLPNGAWSSGRAVNSLGQVLGTSDFPGPGAHAAIWNNGSPFDLGTVGGDTSDGLDINEAGVAVGYSSTGDTTFKFEDDHAFFYKNGVMTDLGTIGPYDNSAAVAINNNDVVVGSLHLEHGGDDSFIWDETNGMRFITTDPDGFVRDINDLGQILFTTYIVESNGALTSLPRGFGADELTNTGWIGGHLSNLTPAIYRDGAFFAVSDLVVDDLGGWQLKYFQGINDSAQMIVEARRGTNEFATILLNPVPEPATIIGVGAALLTLMSRRKIRRPRPDSGACRFGENGV
jgi:probable HAF family extracellular repeat protein